MSGKRVFKDIGEELVYSMSITKGARFNSHRRLLARSKLSNLTIALLTSYIIIINLVGLSQSVNEIIDTTFIALISTALSILVLVFSQVEASNEYILKSEKYHQCAKEIGGLYYKLREVIQNSTFDPAKKEKKYKEIRKSYNQIISRYENHSRIDYYKHMIHKPEDFDIQTISKYKILATEYMETKFLYHLLIILPIIFITAYRFVQFD